MHNVPIVLSLQARRTGWAPGSQALGDLPEEGARGCPQRLELIRGSWRRTARSPPGGATGARQRVRVYGSARRRSDHGRTAPGKPQSAWIDHMQVLVEPDLCHFTWPSA